MIVAQYAAVIVIGYLLGSIPFGLAVSRLSSRTDLRQVGSGRSGATNVLRTSGWKAGVLVLLLDMAKGALAVIFASLIFAGRYPGDMTDVVRNAGVLAALATIVGHNWSVFLGFRGGRGVAAFLGGLLALYWPAAVFGGLVMIFLGGLYRYMSLGSITGAVAAFVLLIALHLLGRGLVLPSPPIQYVVYALVCAIFICVMHRDNISRLLAGTERRLGEKVAVKEPPAESK